MNKTVIQRSERVYDFILKFYPRNYREEFGEEMKYVFSESLKDAFKVQGEVGILTLWTRTVIDTGKSLITQHLENQKGGDIMKTKSNDIIMQNQVFLWIALVTGLVLSIPLIAMQFTNEVDWKAGDFIIMGTLLFGMGSIFVLIARKVTKKNRLAVGLAVLAVLLLLWIHLAVGIVDSWPLEGS